MSSRWLDNRLSPIHAAYTAKPFGYEDVDKHIDGPRIWATIIEVRTEALLEIEVAKQDVAGKEGFIAGEFDDYKAGVRAAMAEFEETKSAENFNVLKNIITAE